MSVREAIESSDLESFGQALAQDVVWVGLWPGELCRNRDDVLEMLARMREREIRPQPSIVAEHDDALIVDPHLEDSERHQVFLLRNGVVAEMRAYPDRAAAVAAVEALG